MKLPTYACNIEWKIIPTVLNLKYYISPDFLHLLTRIYKKSNSNTKKKRWTSISNINNNPNSMNILNLMSKRVIMNKSKINTWSTRKNMSTTRMMENMRTKVNTKRINTNVSSKPNSSNPNVNEIKPMKTL